MNGECTVSNQEILDGLKNRLTQIQTKYAAFSKSAEYQEAVAAIEGAINYHESDQPKDLFEVISKSEQVDYLYGKLSDLTAPK